MTQLERFKKLQKIERQLEKVRGCSPISHGWQTQRYAKASRKWDVLAEEKRRIIKQIQDNCNGFCECCAGQVDCKYP